MSNLYNLYSKSREGRNALQHLMDDEYASNATTFTQEKSVRIFGDQHVVLKNEASYNAEDDELMVKLSVLDSDGRVIMETDHTETLPIIISEVEN